MKSMSKLLFARLTPLAMLAVSGAATAVSLTINTPATSFLVTEAHAPSGVAATTFNGSAGYTQGLWAPGGVSSASLTLFLRDDVSSNLPPFIDAPREWAQLTSVTDNNVTFLNPGALEVDPRLFVAGEVIDGHTVTTAEASAAASIGAENLFDQPPSLGGYFNVDVTGLLNGSNSGALKFLLGADSRYADIPTTDPNYTLITQLSGGATSGEPIFMIEDFIFDHAQLTVDYTPTPGVPEPSVMMLIGAGLMGLLGFRKKYS